MQALDFAADFNSAFGMMPGANEKAIERELEEFDQQFPDIDALSLGEERANSAAAAAVAPAANAEKAENDLTFESVFGTSDQAEDAAAASASASAAVAKPEAASETAAEGEKQGSAEQTNGKSMAGKKADAKGKSDGDGNDDNDNDDDDDSNFVPPPVVKRTIVSARPMSRVLSIFRSSSNSKVGSSLDGNTPAMPRRATASEKRQQQSREQDQKFEE
ncbi:hypothetical protein LPJ75_007063, partial [Coemansia sp. RSA 2598]